MTIAEIALIAIAIVLVRLERIGRMVGSELSKNTAELKSLRLSLVSPESNPAVLNQINGHLYGIAEFTQGTRNPGVRFQTNSTTITAFVKGKL